MSSLQASARQFPRHPVEWLHEIADAYRDAHDTLPFMPLVGVMPSENKLFHLAPRVRVRFLLPCQSLWAGPYYRGVR
jgi:hypothetical protein